MQLADPYWIHPDLKKQKLEYSLLADSPFVVEGPLMLRKILRTDDLKYVQFLEITREDLPTLMEALRAKFGELP